MIKIILGIMISWFCINLLVCGFIVIMALINKTIDKKNKEE